MEALDFTKPSQSPIYDPAQAKVFFESAGVAETVAAGKDFFVERQRRGFFSANDRMYLLLEGTVVLSVGGRSIDTLKAGEIFGEMATVTHSPRSATATAKTDCRVIALDSGNFQKAIQKKPSFALTMLGIMIDRLRLTLARLAMKKSPGGDIAGDERRVFDEKTLNDIAQQLGNPVLLKVEAGRSIIHAGEAGVLMYMPRRGRIAISTDGRVLEHVGVGGVFGEMALVDRAPRTANAVAEIDSELLAVNRQQFLELLRTKPAFGLSLLKLLGQRLQTATAQSAK